MAMLLVQGLTPPHGDVAERYPLIDFRELKQTAN